jgi:hypothetical protein
MFKAMQLANLWRANPQGCEHFGITGDLVKQEYDATKPAIVRPVEGAVVAEMTASEPIKYAPSKPYPYRARMQDMAKRYGSMSMHRKPCRDDMKYKGLPCSCDIPATGLISIVDGEVWAIPEYV